MTYEIEIEAYKGPLDKLLGLVEEKELQITEISLAEVTADFLKYVEKLTKVIEGGENRGIDPSLLADFLVVASKLILIKSKSLIPSLPLTEEEASDIKDLELRLKLYQELKTPKAHLEKAWSEFPRTASREFLIGIGPVFYPPKKVKKEDFPIALKALLLIIEKTLKPVRKIKTEVINLKKKIEDILSRITEAPKTFKSFQNSGTKGELVVMFLAILHLIKEQIILVDQSDHFEEITIVKKGKPA